MASVAQIKARIRSVNSTKQITGAMQLVSASKMRRASERTLKIQPYHHYISELLTEMMGQGLADGHPLIVQRKVKTRLLIVIASDTGLAGAYNANTLKKYVKELERDRERGVKTLTIAVGRKAIQLASRLEVELLAAYEGYASGPAAAERGAIIDTIITKYRQAEIDAVDVIFTKYRSTIKQEVRIWNLLPAGYILEADQAADPMRETVFEFEPSKEHVFGSLVKRAIEVQLAQTFFDSIASEHAMRMLAMKNATDNANDLSEDLVLAMNKERQAAITNELSDINNGANAVK